MPTVKAMCPHYLHGQRVERDAVYMIDPEDLGSVVGAGLAELVADDYEDDAEDDAGADDGAETEQTQLVAPESSPGAVNLDEPPAPEPEPEPEPAPAPVATQADPAIKPRRTTKKKVTRKKRASYRRRDMNPDA